MPDIREIMAALSVDDRSIYQEARSAMRRAFLTAHNLTVGIGEWDCEDDSLLDLFDIRLALLFDRAGRLNATTAVVSKADGETVHKQLESKAVAALENAWGNGGDKK